MLPDFEMIIHKFTAKDGITIIPISDVHLGAKECMEREFMEFIDSVAKTPNVYLILGGDLLCPSENAFAHKSLLTYA